MSFYNFTKNSAGGDELYIDGEIAAGASWWGNMIDPHNFRLRLARCKDVTVFINSPGGDVFAGCEIYTMLREHPYTVTVKVSGIAASAASIIAMGGDRVLMSPVGHMMVHYPWTIAIGNAKEMDYTATVLREIGEGIIAAYMSKTGKTRDEISAILDAETYMNASHCVAEGFADGILYENADNAQPATSAGAAAGTPPAAKMSCKRYTADAICAMMTGSAAQAGNAHTPAQAIPTRTATTENTTDDDIGKRMQKAATVLKSTAQIQAGATGQPVTYTIPTQPSQAAIPQTAERRAIAQRAELLRDVYAGLLANARAN